MMRRWVVVRAASVTFVAAMLLSAAAVPQPAGTLTGTATDTLNQPLPGVRVTVTSGVVQRTVVTDAEGRYHVPTLSAGSYVVRAHIAGFKSVERRDVMIEAGTTVTLPLVLEMNCLEDVDYIDPGFAAAAREATMIAHIRILRSHPPGSCEGGQVCVCTEHVAIPMRLFKPVQAVLPAPLRFVQEAAGRLPDGSGNSRAYAPTQQFIAFLRWEPKTERYTNTVGPGYMFPVRDGRVEFHRTDAPGMRNGMTVEEFGRALEAALARVAIASGPGA
jgi:hypothetical protein